MKTKKRCADCQDMKSLDEFHVNRALPDGRHYYCKKCQNERGAKWRERNQGYKRPATVQRAYYIKHKYGITVEKYDAILRRQNGLCPICRRKLRKPSIDHCHSTGKIRGILCRHCNSSLSVFENDPEAINRLQAYLGHQPVR